MPSINKEPYITPEMIAAWNAGSGINIETIYDKVFVKGTDTFTQGGTSPNVYYECPITIPMTTNTDIFNSKYVMISISKYFGDVQLGVCSMIFDNSLIIGSQNIAYLQVTGNSYSQRMAAILSETRIDNANNRKIQLRLYDDLYPSATNGNIARVTISKVN